MKFISTRGQVEPVAFSEAVALGLAPDGGLFLPERMPDLSETVAEWEGLSYEALCFEFMKLFATDIPEERLAAMIERSYAGFESDSRAPLVKLDEDLWVLELFHGPTLAFKDFALQLLGNIYEYQIEQTGVPINVLGATSGDTGAAAIHGLLGKKGVKIFILYPDGRVAPLQERQMVCTEADNVFPLAITGSFDDAQRELKEVFGDHEFQKDFQLSAVNSINLARILAQCVYYLHGFLRLPAEKREQVTFVVPTGNFGNVLAGWMVQQMGVPIKGFRVATNQNDILHRLFNSGIYELGDVEPSLAPSMDIQVASNFERFLYFNVHQDPAKVCEIMKTFKETGYYRFENWDDHGFSSSRTDDAGIREIIAAIYQRFNYVADPHTACGFQDYEQGGAQVILSTAHPAKFPDTIEEVIGYHPTHEFLEALKSKEVIKYPMSPNAQSIKDFIRSKA